MVGERAGTPAMSLQCCGFYAGGYTSNIALPPHSVAQVLVLKTYLKACRLNEVNRGGLSSYSLTNMVIAHLQEELKVCVCVCGKMEVRGCRTPRAQEAGSIGL